MFYDEVADILKIDAHDFVAPRITVYGKTGASVEGHRGLLYFSETEIKFRIRGGALTLTGEKLSLYQVTEKEAVVAGRITAVAYV